jgi:hypothetical protein
MDEENNYCQQRNAKKSSTKSLQSNMSSIANINGGEEAAIKLL